MATSFMVPKNRAESTLASGITDVATTLTVASGEGANFPSTFDFPITIGDEILLCTARSTDTLTVTRAQEGTSGAAHSAGDTVQLRITAKFISDFVTAVNTLEAPPTCRAYNDANESVPNAAVTALSLNQERWDTDTMHDLSTNNSRITFVTAGTYAIAGTIKFAANATGQRQIVLRLDGSTNIANMKNNASSAGSSHLAVSTQYQVSANQYVELCAYQNSGGALNVEVSAQQSAELTAVRIGD